jgi:hypothetical protein
MAPVRLELQAAIREVEELWTCPLMPEPDHGQSEALSEWGLASLGLELLRQTGSWPHFRCPASPETATFASLFTRDPTAAYALVLPGLSVAWFLLSGGTTFPRHLLKFALMEGATATVMHAHQLIEQTEPDDWAYLIVRGVWDDPGLWNFDARYEFTMYSTELLWGPGTRGDALAWLEATAPAGDEIHHLDRVFAISRHDGRLYPPCRPDVLLGLPPDHQAGTWDVVRSDFPEDCLRHVGHIAVGEPCGTWGCAADDIAQESWADAVAAVRNLVPGLNIAAYSEARVPQCWPLTAEQ